MNSNEIRGLLERIRSQFGREHQNGDEWASAKELDAAIQSYGGVNRNETRKRAEILTYAFCPSLLFTIPRMPEPGQQTYVTLTLIVPSVYRTVEPVLWVKLPDGILAASDQVCEAKEAELACFRDCAQQLGQSRWKAIRLAGNGQATLDFRWPEDLIGTFLWQFRFGFPSLWGHSLLPRFYAADLPMEVLRVDDTGAEFHVADGAGLHIGDLARFRNVKVVLGKDARLDERRPEIDYAAIYRQHGHGADDSADAGRRAEPIPLDCRPLQSYEYSRDWKLISTGRTSGSDAWQTQRLGILQFPKPDLEREEFVNHEVEPQQQRPLQEVSGTLRVHLSPPALWKLGRNSANDIPCDFQPRDDDELGFHVTADPEATDEAAREASIHQKLEELRRSWRQRISGFNSELLLAKRGLEVVNTGTPGSASAGRTVVEFFDPENQRRKQQILQTRDEEIGLDANQVLPDINAVRVGIGGENASRNQRRIEPFWIHLVPIRTAHDSSSNGIASLPMKAPFEGVRGRFRTPGRWAGELGIDGLVVRPELRSRQQDPVDLLLFRQAWLTVRGGLAVDPDQVFRTERPLARLIPISVTDALRNDDVHGVLLQRVHRGMRLRVLHSPETATVGSAVAGAAPARSAALNEIVNETDLVENYDAAVLSDGDTIICSNAAGEEQWRAVWHYGEVDDGE